MFDNWFNSVTNENKEETEQEAEKRNIHMISQLHKILKPFMLRRTKLEVEKSLPPKKEIHIFVGLTDMQLKVYKNLLQNRNASD
jgi:SNF2 family DNA or RNA helicase